MLTDLQCKTASCPPDKRHARFTDAGGLYLQVDQNGSKRWFWKYRTSGVEKRIALGAYPDVSLRDARLARDEARAVKSGGQDPVEKRKVKKLKESANLADTFKETALEWYEKNKSRWSSHYAIRELRNLEKDLFPFLGERRIGQIETIELLGVIRKVEARGALDVAHRVLSTSRFVWRYGVATARCPRDITIDLKGALTPHHGKHFAAITDPEKFGTLLKTIRNYQGGPIVRAALQLAC